jgi:tetratricopeptide (TPR) repeat protein
MKKVVSVGILAASLLVICGCTVTKQGLVSKGNKLFAAGKYEDAAIFYRKAIQKDPRFGEAHYRLGLAALKMEDTGQAYAELLKAVRIVPDNIDAKEAMGSLALEYYLLDTHHSSNYYSLVKELSDALLAQDPNSFEGSREKAYLAAMDRQPKIAITYFRKALQVKPSDASVTTALVKMLGDNGETQEAEKLGLDFIARYKTDSLPVYDELYELYVNNKRPADAENILKTKLANNPKDAATILQLAAHYARQNKPAEINATLDRMLNDEKDFPDGGLWVGDFWMKVHDYPVAIHYYEEGARRQTTDSAKIVYQKRAANALVAQGKRVEASRIVDQVLKEDPSDNEALRVQANLLLRAGQSETVEAANADFQTLSKRTSDDARVWLGLGRVDQFKGNLTGARAQYLEALRKKRDYLPARYALAEIGLRQHHPDETVAQTNEILRIRPNDSRARLLRAEAYMGSGNPALARAELTSLIRDFPNETEPRLQLGMLAISEKKYSEAVAILAKLPTEKDTRPLAALAAAYTEQKQFDKALQLLSDSLKKSPDDPVLRAQLVSSAALGSQYELAINELRKLIAADPKSVQLWLRLGEISELKNDYSGAVAAYRAAVALAPNDATSQLALASALSNAGRTDEARKQYENVLKVQPDNTAALNNLAFLLLETGGDLDKALGFAQQALRKTPDQPGFADTMGCIYLKKGLKDSAIQVFDNLVRQYPKQPAFHYHLGMALFEKGDKTKAKRELQTAQTLHPSAHDQERIRELLGKIS